ncbi:hypothetical protein YTPLAS72_09990 [Nitrospira sp.]|nr:hypothetical protein YTPLAS72_09990 [Nitrospira sp.]
MSEQPHYLETLYKELALALGDAVWAFARIEWLTYSCLRGLSRDCLDELVGDLNFRNRTAILRRLINAKNSSQNKKERAYAAIKVAEELSDRRNIIVHNPWQIWVDLDSEKLMINIEKYSQREKTVDLDRLREFTKRAGEVEVELKESVYAL